MSSLLAALSLAWPYFAGLGALPALAPLTRSGGQEEATPLRLLAAVWTHGLCLNYVLLLLLGQLSITLSIGAGLAMVMGAAALWQWRDRLRPSRVTALVLATGIRLASVVAIVLDPLSDWDARSVWFFHGKMIFFSGGITRTTGLGLNIGYDDHPEYPMLVPGLAAQVAQVVGFWNEYLPKFSLVLLLPVPILAVLDLRNTPSA